MHIAVLFIVGMISLVIMTAIIFDNYHMSDAGLVKFFLCISLISGLWLGSFFIWYDETYEILETKIYPIKTITSDEGKIFSTTTGKDGEVILLTDVYAETEEKMMKWEHRKYNTFLMFRYENGWIHNVVGKE